jgi:hypothetical protein
MTSAETARSKDYAATGPCPPGRLIGSRSRAATWDEERREVFDSVLQAMRLREPDADRMAACAYLLRHLARTEHCC